LGLMYGMGKGKMAIELDLNEDDASSLIKQFHEKVPFMRGLVAGVQEKINRGGYDESGPKGLGAIFTLLGRRCRFPLWEPVLFGVHKALPFEQAMQKYHPNHLQRAYTYKGLNRLIQGSAADQTKKAIVECVRECGVSPLVQVHDELCFSVSDREQAEALRKVMETCVELDVPSKVDLEMGPSWGEAT